MVDADVAGASLTLSGDESLWSCTCLHVENEWILPGTISGKSNGRGW